MNNYINFFNCKKEFFLVALHINKHIFYVVSSLMVELLISFTMKISLS